jgi:hypothetical protein
MSRTQTNQPVRHQPTRKSGDAWHRHPALIAAIAIVPASITAGVTLYLGKTGQLPEAVSPPAVTVTATSFSTVTVSAPSSGATDGGGTAVPPPPPSSSGQLVWHETVSTPPGFGLDIDQAKPVVVQFYGDFRATTVGNGAGGILQDDARAGRSSSPTPTSQDCRDVVDTAAVADPFSMEVGRTVCILSRPGNGAHVAAVRLLAFKPDHSMSLDVTVWTTD